NARIVISILAYLWIIIGLLFLLSPWWFRRLANHLIQHGEGVIRISGAVKALFGAGLIALALFMY
ncbi:MAG: DUF2065 family protein, partial [Kiritimatiellaceae bacterium]|nr:DUF2065 family protein [Kiritimatiellaceae bacterium]